MELLPYLTIKMQIVILCGGKATRLNGLLGKDPKVLAKINDEPFIDSILKYLFDCESINRITLLTGVGSELISTYILKNYSNSPKVLDMYKDNFLGQGTSQALNQALEDNVLEEKFLLMFGDSLPDLDLNDFIKNSIESESAIFFSYIDGKYVDEESRIEIVDGAIRYHSELETRDFTLSSSFFIDYGVYYINMNQEIKSLIKAENDLKKVLEKFSIQNKCLGSECVNPFIEIGNPISFASAHDKIRDRFSK